MSIIRALVLRLARKFFAGGSRSAQVVAGVDPASPYPLDGVWQLDADCAGHGRSRDACMIVANRVSQWFAGGAQPVFVSDRGAVAFNPANGKVALQFTIAPIGEGGQPVPANIDFLGVLQADGTVAGSMVTTSIIAGRVSHLIALSATLTPEDGNAPPASVNGNPAGVSRRRFESMN